MGRESSEVTVGRLSRPVRNAKIGESQESCRISPNCEFSLKGGSSIGRQQEHGKLELNNSTQVQSGNLADRLGAFSGEIRMQVYAIVGIAFLHFLGYGLTAVTSIFLK